MEAQRQLDEPELSGLDPVWSDLRRESDLAGFPPGEDVEEAAERSAVPGTPVPGAPGRGGPMSAGTAGLGSG
jgi:hypothetical protein